MAAYVRPIRHETQYCCSHQAPHPPMEMEMCEKKRYAMPCRMSFLSFFFLTYLQEMSSNYTGSRYNRVRSNQRVEERGCLVEPQNSHRRKIACTPWSHGRMDWGYVRGEGVWWTRSFGPIRAAGDSLKPPSRTGPIRSSRVACVRSVNKCQLRRAKQYTSAIGYLPTYAIRGEIKKNKTRRPLRTYAHRT